MSRVKQVMPAPFYDDYLAIGSSYATACLIINALGLAFNLTALVLLIVYRGSKYLQLGQIHFMAMFQARPCHSLILKWPRQ